MKGGGGCKVSRKEKCSGGKMKVRMGFVGVEGFRYGRFASSQHGYGRRGGSLVQ